ncbi:VWA domain-containing protein [Candidatus Woesearchaeota archaeon]|nr:VWA domain-containing protein [Candidatus Woesearchaeota archaeon]
MIRDHRANAFLVLLFVGLMLVFALMVIYQAQPFYMYSDDSVEGKMTAELALKKSLYSGAFNSLQNGLSKDGKAWYCNQVFPPNIPESTLAFTHHTLEHMYRTSSELRNHDLTYSLSDAAQNVEFGDTETLDFKVPGDVIIITDLSGSMSFLWEGKRKDQVVREMNELMVNTIINSSPGTRIGLVVYDYDASIMVPPTDDASALYEAIDQMIAPDSGATCISCSIYKAVEALLGDPLQPRPNRPLSILVMSDGGANYCHNSDNIEPMCVLLTGSQSAACDRATARAQAIDYARQANQTYNIVIYAIVMASDTNICTSRGAPITDCYDPITMQEIARVGGGKYAESDNEAELATIYEQFGKEIGRYSLASYDYLSLAGGDFLVNISDHTGGAISDTTMYQITESFQYQSNYNATYWNMYKYMVSWMIYVDDTLFTTVDFKKLLTPTAGCQAIYTGDNCSSGHLISNDTLASMKGKISKSFFPETILQEVQASLDGFLYNTSITCEASYEKLNLTHLPMFDYRDAAPQNLPVGSVFGKGKLSQTGDGTTARVSCADEGKELDRDNFLAKSSVFSVGNLGPATLINSVCDPSKYEYIGIDTTMELDILVECSDLTMKPTFDQKSSFGFQELEFIIRFDLLNDCDPPIDQNNTVVSC